MLCCYVVKEIATIFLPKLTNLSLQFCQIKARIKIFIRIQINNILQNQFNSFIFIQSTSIFLMENTYRQRWWYIAFVSKYSKKHGHSKWLFQS